MEILIYYTLMVITFLLSFVSSAFPFAAWGPPAVCYLQLWISVAEQIVRTSENHGARQSICHLHCQHSHQQQKQERKAEEQIGFLESPRELWDYCHIQRHLVSPKRPRLFPCDLTGMKTAGPSHKQSRNTFEPVQHLIRYLFVSVFCFINWAKASRLFIKRAFLLLKICKNLHVQAKGINYFTVHFCLLSKIALFISSSDVLFTLNAPFFAANPAIFI